MKKDSVCILTFNKVNSQAYVKVIAVFCDKCPQFVNGHLWLFKELIK